METPETQERQFAKSQAVNTAYPDNELANNIASIVSSIPFGEGFDIAPVTTTEAYKALLENHIGIDYRAKAETSEGLVSVFEGLAFDPENLRSQTFTLSEAERPIGCISLIIAPKSWVEKQRYFEQVNGGLALRDAHSITGGDIPEFYIIPGWTKVETSHRGDFGIQGVRALTKVIQRLTDEAPENTWIEMAPQGLLPKERFGETEVLAKQYIGEFIADKDLPFEPSIVGGNTEGSNSTVKMARLMGMQKIENIVSSKTLGPVFAKRV